MEIPCNRTYVNFHGYKILRTGLVLSKQGKPMKFEKRDRRGGGFDFCVRLYYRGKQKKWTVQRLVANCFLGPIDGYEINHKDGNPENNNVINLERLTPSENQKHWRQAEKDKNDTSQHTTTS